MTAQRAVVAAIVGQGRVGTELCSSLRRRDPRPDAEHGAGFHYLDVQYVVDRASGGVEWLLRQDPLPDLVFEATTAAAHRAHAVRYAEAGIPVIDLTPSSVGLYACPFAGVKPERGTRNVSAVSAGGQATIPIVRAVSEVVPVSYAEVVSSIASTSAGPGMRSNIDEVTRTTSGALEALGNAARAKSITVISPAEPAMAMRSTVFCAIPPHAAEPGPQQDAVTASIHAAADQVRQHVPGFALRADPQYEPARGSWHGQARVMVLIEVAHRDGGDRHHAGNLDLITTAAGEIADHLLGTGVAEGER